MRRPVFPRPAFAARLFGEVPAAEGAASTAPLLFLSVGTGYGGAERSLEIIARTLPADLSVTVLAENARHLAALRASAQPRVRIMAVQSDHDAAFRQAVRRFVRLYAQLRPGAVLANTCMSARILAAARADLPDLDARAFLYIRDFLWEDGAAILAALPRAQVIVPDSCVLERPGYLDVLKARDCGHALWVIPDMVEMPDASAPRSAPGRGFLHMATVNPWKGHQHLIRAMARLRSAGGQARLVSVGDHPSAARTRGLEAEIAAHGLADAVELRDFVAHPAPLLEACKAVVVASVSHSGGPETFGRAIIEAWSHRRPVIAFAAGAPARMIRDGADGLLVPEGDEAALAAAMQRLDADPALCAALGQAGFERVRAEFSAAPVVARLVRVLSAAPPPASRYRAAIAGLRAVRPRARAAAATAAPEAAPVLSGAQIRLLCDCIAAPWSADARARARTGLAGPGLTATLACAEQLRLGPSVVAGVRAGGLAPPIPAAVLKDGRRTVTREMDLILAEHDERRQMLARHLAEIVGALNQAGIAPLLIKGARSLWRDGPRWRTLRDLDLVVEAHAADAAQAILRSRGYAPDPAAAERPHRHHLAPLFRDDLAGWIEIHRRVGNRYAEPLLPTGELLRHSTEVARAEGRARVLDGPWHVLHGLVHHHFGHSGFARGTLDLKGLVEFHLEIAALDAPARQEVQARAERHPLLLAALDLWVAAAADLLDAPPLPPLEVRADARRRWQAVAARMAGEATPSWKYPGYAEEVRAGLARARQVYPGAGPLAAAGAAWDVARGLLPKLPF